MMNEEDAIKERAATAPKIIQNQDGSLDKISCLKWAKYMGFKLPDVFWQQLKEHEENE